MTRMPIPDDDEWDLLSVEEDVMDADLYGRLHRLRVPGGWLYRNQYWKEGVTDGEGGWKVAPALVAMTTTFVPWHDNSGE
jgi:hypothetical protein